MIGTTKTVEDQAGRKRQGTTDALGNMVRVIEDPSGSPLVTDYVFDTLGNLRKTTQGDQSRYFSYDSLGRVLRARQVEQDVNTNLALASADPITSNNSWTVGYSYDDNGNIETTTDAKNNSITATYDRLNRLKTRDYSDAGTPDVSFYYDGRGLGGSPPANSNGKTTKVTSTVSETRFTTFDEMGRVKTSEQHTDGEIYPFEYTYNLAGALIEETYPSTRKVKYTLNADGELAQVQSKKNSSSGYWKYADAFSYNESGAVLKMQLGNGRWETAGYNDRQQVELIGLGSTDDTRDLLMLEFRYGVWNGSTLDESRNNGSMVEQKITVPVVGSNPTFTAIQKYNYDALNRIQDATETVSSTQTWKQTFSYDRYGNRRFNTSGSNTTTIPGGCSAAICNPDINTADNQLSASQGYNYDENGALTEDALGQRFGYDAESHQKEFFSASNSGSVPDATYHYDGDGRRVKKIVGTEVTIFVYDAGGQLVEEYSTTIASVQDAQVSYLTTDHLGSPRIITNENGAVTNRKDFTAFGETVTSSQRVGGSGGNNYDDPADVIRQDYTGYQKDQESGLEFAQARYYNLGHGRFTSVDPLTASATIRNPQSFNRYSYVLNSPYKFSDPLGLFPEGGGGCGKNRCRRVGRDSWMSTATNRLTYSANTSANNQGLRHEHPTNTDTGAAQQSPPQAPPSPLAEQNQAAQNSAQEGGEEDKKSRSDLGPTCPGGCPPPENNTAVLVPGSVFEEEQARGGQMIPPGVPAQNINVPTASYIAHLWLVHLRLRIESNLGFDLVDYEYEVSYDPGSAIETRVDGRSSPNNGEAFIGTFRVYQSPMHGDIPSDRSYEATGTITIYSSSGRTGTISFKLAVTGNAPADVTPTRSTIIWR